MPYVIHGQAGRNFRRRRFLQSGPPNSRKTGALLTMPGRIAILSLPGEKGWDTVPTDDPRIVGYNWERGDGPRDSKAIVAEVFDTSVRIIGSGDYDSIGPDGLHKFYDYILDDVSGGNWFERDLNDVDLDRDFGKFFGAAQKRFMDYLSVVMHSAVPVVGMTSWDAPEKDRAKKPSETSYDYARTVGSHLYPDLPGKVAKAIIGEFTMVFHNSVGKLKPNDAEEIGLWQTRPYGQVWGCGVKAPSAIGKRIPTFVPADYQYFDQMYTYLEELVAKERAVNPTLEEKS